MSRHLLWHLLFLEVVVRCGGQLVRIAFPVAKLGRHTDPATLIICEALKLKQHLDEPKPDFGFYAAVPRVVRTGYKNLTAAQKWLYVCLKDLCGDHGTCYRSLRTLSEETGISTGMLSESIRDLHEAELIHAEKKKRSEGGKEVWHITVADIWIANGKLHPSKRSQNEQTSGERSQKALSSAAQNENVHPVNENVQPANDKGRKRSAGERERSFCETEERTKKQEHLEERKEKETPAVPTSPAPAQSSLSPSSQNNSHQKKQVQVVHPLHRFLLLDDAIAPTTLTILLTSGTHESELEDDRRMRIAEEVQWDLEARGHIVQGVCVREREQTVVEVPPASLLERLTDAQADFWRRWCALSHCGDDALTEKQLPDIAWLAERVTSTADLESLYRSNAAMLLDLSQAKGTQYTPPHLKNLVKHHPTWASAQDAKQKQREQASKKTVSGTGAVKNWTMARLSGKMDAPPVVYPDIEKPKKSASIADDMGIKGDLAAMFERMRG